MKESTILKRMKGFGNVSNMTSSKGNDVPNQFIIYFDNGSIFKSYNSIIAVKHKGVVYLGSNWEYSATTGKYRGQFLGEGVADTRVKIKNGTYKLLK